MSTTTVRAGAAQRRPPTSALLAITAVGLCWVLSIGLAIAGRTDLISHDAIIEGGRLPLPLAIGLFILIWQLMTGAMMLPSALPVIAVFGRVSSSRPRPRLTQLVFLSAYFATWSGFALAALGGDVGIHWMVDRWPWLDARPWLIGGTLLIGAGIFQLTPLKERCLTECRNPLQFVWKRYRPGVAGAWRLGVAHALFCVGCCWALMLVMFALGVGSLTVMSVLGGIMALEKVWRRGARLVPWVSAGLVGLGLLVMLAPGWVNALPALP